MTYYDPASYTQTREIGFVERVGGSLIGIPIGIILIFFPMALLWWNEHRNVEASEAIELALEKVITVPSTAISPQNNGRLVHVVGTGSAAGVIDQGLGLTLPSTLVAQRHVEMYQWRERKSEQTNNNWGGSQTVTTSYGYESTWSSEWFDSRNFKIPTGHVNPSMPVRSAVLPAEDAKLGAFRLGGSTLAALAEGPGLIFSEPTGFQHLRPEKLPAGYRLTPEGSLYRGKDPARPVVGDLRVTYSGVPSGSTVTVVAKQSGEGFTDYPMARGYTFQLASVGNRSAQALLEERASRENTLTWVLRCAGVLVMWAGFMLLLGPLAVLVSIVPFLGTLAEALTADIAFVLALILGSLTIAVAWLFVHPVISIIFIIVTLVLGGTYIYVRRG